MIYGSVCSGIEAASVAWEPLGWKPSFFSEIAKFPSAVLEYRFPGVRNLGDFTTIRNRWTKRIGVHSIDLLVGGTPCQSFSVAGLRGGMDDARGQLSLEFLRLARRLRPRWVLWENVPGVLSSDGGRAFGGFLGSLAELGYGWAYRILNAEYFGVPQRRRRVFVVGHLGDQRRAASVLFERDCLRGNSPPGRETRKDLAGSLRARPNASHREDSDTYVPDVAYKVGTQDRRVGNAHNSTMIARTLTGRNDRLDGECDNFIAFHGSQDPCISGDVTYPLGTNNGIEACVAFQCQGSNVGEMGTLRGGNGNSAGGVPFIQSAFTQNTRDEVREIGGDGQIVGALASQTGSKQQACIRGGMSVRRLTPVECERLQGFPDDWTLVPYRGKPASDGPRYAAIGNSMAVPVMRWVGRRIELVDAIPTSTGASS